MTSSIALIVAEVPVDAAPIRDRLTWLITTEPGSVTAFAGRSTGRQWLRSMSDPNGQEPPPWRGWVPIVAAGPTAGRIGFVRCGLHLTDRTEHEARTSASESERTAFEVRDHYQGATLREVLGRRSVTIDPLIPRGCGGDSLALSCAAAVTAAALEGDLDPRTAFSGGWGKQGNRAAFQPPAPETLDSKLRCLASWGIARLVVPKGTTLPADRHGVEIVEVDHDAAALAATLVEKGILRIARSERIAAIVTLLDRQSGSGRWLSEGARRLLEQWANGSDPLPRALAADLLGRMSLHAGRTEEAMQRFDHADACTLSPLPESPIREQWRYERPAVRQVAMIDAGHFREDGMIPQAARANDTVDRAIDRLRAEEILTRPEWFMRFILQNTRARRWEYLGRLHGDAAHLERAWGDLTAEHGRWEDLVEIARTDLGRSDTSVERTENQCIDLLQSCIELAAADASQGSVPGVWLEMARRFARGRSPLAGLRSYDLLGWLKLRAAIDGGVDAADLRKAAETLGVHGGGSGGDGAVALGYPDFISLEWLLRLDRTHSLPTEQLAEALQRAVDARTESDGIFRILALRSAAVLQVHAGRRDALSLVPESGIASLRSLRTAILGDGKPEGIMRRCPY